MAKKTLKVHFEVDGRDACGFAAWTSQAIADLGWYKKIPSNTPQITSNPNKVTCGHCRKLVPTQAVKTKDESDVN